MVSSFEIPFSISRRPAILLGQYLGVLFYQEFLIAHIQLPCSCQNDAILACYRLSKSLWNGNRPFGLPSAASRKLARLRQGCFWLISLRGSERPLSGILNAGNGQRSLVDVERRASRYDARAGRLVWQDLRDEEGCAPFVRRVMQILRRRSVLDILLRNGTGGP